MPQNMICSDDPARPINVLLLTKHPMAMVHYDVGHNETRNQTRPGNLDMGDPFTRGCDSTYCPFTLTIKLG